MDARVAKTRASVIATATDLLVEGGPGAVTVDAIVARSGVAKSTIYRHWDSRDEILIAVMESCAPDFDTPDEAFPFDVALRELVHEFRRLLLDPNWARIVPALFLLKAHLAEVADLNERLGQRQRHALDDIVARGVAAGVLDPDLPVDTIAALVVGPMVFSTLTGMVELTEQFADCIVDTFLAAHTRVPA